MGMSRFRHKGPDLLSGGGVETGDEANIAIYSRKRRSADPEHHRPLYSQEAHYLLLVFLRLRLLATNLLAVLLKKSKLGVCGANAYK